MVPKEVCHWKEIQGSFILAQRKVEILPLNCPTSKTIVITLHNQKNGQTEGQSWMATIQSPKEIQNPPIHSSSPPYTHASTPANPKQISAPFPFSRPIQS